MSTTTDLKKTPFHAIHHALKAKMVDFGGWEMPVEYPGEGGGLIAEHTAVRTGVGLFDVSHMGQIRLYGNGALGSLQYTTMNDAERLQDFQCQYSALLAPNGGFIDDILVYRFGHEDFMLVVNAANVEKDLDWLKNSLEQPFPDVDVEDCSNVCALLALQGPKAKETLQKLTRIKLDNLKRYWFTYGEVAGVPDCIVSRTGYTGEDGYELYLQNDPESNARIWHALLEAGAEFGIRPCGLGARNTLRLEAGMPLYGHEISEHINVYEAGLERWLKSNRGAFVGEEVLEAIRQAGGPKRKLVGLEMVERGIARDGYAVCSLEGEPIGEVTSGSPSPTLGTHIALALVPAEIAESKSDVLVDVRGKKLRARQIPTPFYKAAKS